MCVFGGGDKADSTTGLTQETLEVGWALIDAGSLRWTAARFTILSTLNGPTNRGAIFVGVAGSGRPLEETFEGDYLLRGWSSNEKS